MCNVDVASDTDFKCCLDQLFIVLVTLDLKFRSRARSLLSRVIRKHGPIPVYHDSFSYDIESYEMMFCLLLIYITIALPMIVCTVSYCIVWYSISNLMIQRI